jgi:cytochrome P450
MGVDALTLAPKNPLPYWQRLKAVRSFVDGFQTLVQAGGPVTRIVLGPKWLFPNMVLIGSPQGARDLLGASVAVADRGLDRAMVENRTLFGGNLVNLPHERWLPRRRAVQPMFTKHHVPRLCGTYVRGRTSGRRRVA